MQSGEARGNVTVVHEIEESSPGQRLVARGPAPRDARLTMILVHGRGASSESILTVADDLALSDVAWLAPQAPGHTWYPYSFLTPMDQNEPHLGAALARLGAVLRRLESEGIDRRRIGLLGFSQGACLALEFAARNAGRYAGIAGLCGGLIGPPGTPRDYTGTFDGTPVFLGCGDTDAHIPLARVHETADVFRRMGAGVDERIYPGKPHAVIPDELDAVRAMLGG